MRIFHGAALVFARAAGDEAELIGEELLKALHVRVVEGRFDARIGKEICRRIFRNRRDAFALAQLMIQRVVRSEDRRQGGHRAVHQSDEAGLDDLEDEPPAGVAVLLGLGAFGKVPGLDVGSRPLMRHLGLRQVPEQLANGGVGGAAGGLKVEAPRFLLHPARLGPDGIDALSTHLPVWAALDPTLDVLATDQRDVGAEALGEHVDQRTPMLVLLGGHVDKHLGAVRVALPEAFGKVEIDAAVLLLAADRKGEKLPLVELGDGLHRNLQIRTPPICPAYRFRIGRDKACLELFQALSKTRTPGQTLL